MLKTNLVVTPGVVHECVDPAKCCHRPLDRLRAMIRSLEFERNNFASGTKSLEFALQFLASRAVTVNNYRNGALGRAGAYDSRTNTLSAASDDHDLVF